MGPCGYPSELHFTWLHANSAVSTAEWSLLQTGHGLYADVLRRTKKILDDNPELQKQWTSLIPVGKMGRPEDLMGAVTFLSSDASLYVNVGQFPFLCLPCADQYRRVRI